MASSDDFIGQNDDRGGTRRPQTGGGRHLPYGAPPRNMNHTPNDHRLINVHYRNHPPISLLLGDGPVTVEGGFGGFSEVARPRDTAISDWPGTPALKLAIPVMIDSWIASGKGPGTVPDVDTRLERILRIGRGKPRDERPFQFRLYGKVLPARTRGHIFGLVDIDWGESAVGPEHGVFQRQALTLHVMEYNAPDNLKIHRRHRRHHHHHNGGGHGGRGDGGHGNKVVAKQGDDLQTIAAEQYGDWTLWTDIAEENGKINPRDIVVGEVILIP